MKLLRNTILSLFFLIACITIYHNVYTPWLISGKYIYCCSTDVKGTIKEGDILQLNSNETFKSSFLGNGSFKVSLSRLELEIGKKPINLSFYAQLYRPWFLGNPRIKVGKNTGYFERVNSN